MASTCAITTPPPCARPLGGGGGDGDDDDYDDDNDSFHRRPCHLWPQTAQLLHRPLGGGDEMMMMMMMMIIMIPTPYVETLAPTASNCVITRPPPCARCLGGGDDDR